MYFRLRRHHPRSDEVETVDQIVQRAEKALNYLPPEQIWLNPDCGFATFLTAL